MNADIHLNTILCTASRCLIPAIILVVAISLVSTSVVLTSEDVRSDTGTVFHHGDFEFTVVSIDDMEVEVSAYSGSNQSVAIPDTVKDDTDKDYRVVSIGIGAFRGNTSAVSVTIPGSISGIGDRTFQGCTSLHSITVPDNVKSLGSFVFKDCTSIEHISLGKGIDTIGMDTFSGCISLKTVTIPDWIRTIGNSAFYGCSSLRQVTIGNGVDMIDSEAFSRCTSLQSIDMPDCVRILGDNVFYNCTSLTSVKLSSNMDSMGRSVFSECTSLRSIEIPDNTISIGRGVFRDCFLLESVTLGTGLQSIPNQTFQECVSLSSISLNEGITSIGSYAFDGCSSLTSISLSSNLSAIGNSAFNDCHSLVEICNPSGLGLTPGSSGNGYIAKYALNIYSPESGTSMLFHHQDFTFIENGERYYLVKYTGHDTSPVLPDRFSEGKRVVESYGILKHAFSGFSTMSSVTMPDCVTLIDEYAFEGCTSLTSIDIPDSVTSIGIEAFRGCTALVRIDIGSGVTVIGLDAFLDCTSLEMFIVSADNSSFSSDAHGVLFDKVGTTLLSYPVGNKETFYHIDDRVMHIKENAFADSSFLVTLVIGNGVVSIGDHGFDGCHSLTSVTIGSGVVSIGNYAFNGCASLGSIMIPDNVVSILDYAFHNCEGMTSVVIGAGVEIISDHVFHGCSSMTSLTIGSGVSHIGDSSFRGCSELKELTFPKNVRSVDKYAFYGCTGLTTVSIGDGVGTIGDYAFRGCTSLETIVLSENLEAVSNGLFYGCSSLTSIIIPDRVSSIGNNAFRGCGSLVSVTIGDGVTSMGSTPFFGCGQVRYLSLPISLNAVSKNSSPIFKDLTSIESIRFTKGSGEGFDYGTDSSARSSNYYGHTPWYLSRDSLGKVEYASTITHIGDYGLVGCHRIMDLPLPEGLSTIGAHAFEGLSGITSLTLPHGLDSIGERAFSGCPNFDTISFGDSLSSIGEAAFDGWIFYDSDGVTELEHTADLLRGSIFVEIGERMVRQITFTVTFVVNGTVIAIVQYKSGDVSVEEPVIEEMPGYIVYWPEYVLEGDIVVEAVIELKDLVIRFDPNGGGGMMIDMVTNVEEDLSPDCGFTPPHHHRFKGWSFSSDGVVLDMPFHITEDVVLYAIWEPEEHSVTYLVDGSVVFTETHPYGTHVRVRDVYFKVGHTVSDWYTDDVQVIDGMFLVGDKDVVFTASSTINQYVISFDTHGGSRVDDIVLDYGATIIPPSNPVRIGYTFAGWCLDGAEYVFDTMPAYDLELDAVWTAISFEVSFVVNDIPVPGYPLSMEYGSIIPVPDIVPSIPNVGDLEYIFLGWLGFHEGMTVVGDMTFHAEFIGSPASFRVDTGGDLSVDSTTEESIYVSKGFLSDVLATMGPGALLTLHMKEGRITLDHAAMCMLEGGERIVLKKAGYRDVPESVRDKVSGCPLYEIGIGDIHDFGRGSLIIGLHHIPSDGEYLDQMEIWHIGDDGNIHIIPFIYDHADNVIEFRTCSLSHFAIVPIVPSGGWDDHGTVLGVALFVIISIALMVLVLFNRRMSG